MDKLDCDDLTKAYIISIFTRYQTAIDDLSNRSITISFARAKEKQDFIMFQNIGDYIFFCNTLFPEHFRNASEDYYLSIGQLSYYKCYKLINKQMRVYECMADSFEPLSISARTIIRQL